MTGSDHLARATLLMAQRRYADAEAQLRGCLGEQPEHPEAHARLAICLGQRRAFAEADEAARTALRLAPEHPISHVAMASVHEEQERYGPAEAALTEAIRLDPANAALHAAVASVRLARQRWAEALQAAERALTLDPEEIDAHNARTIALTHLGRRAGAVETARATLARDPANATSHAALGWALLHNRDHGHALASFKEALRLDPTLEWSRQGLLEALRARNPVYRALLRYFLWTSRMDTRRRWLVIVAGIAVARLLGPLAVLWLLFVLSTWLLRPLMNLLLRLDRYGSLVLDRDEVVASNWIGGMLLASLALGVGAAVTRVPAVLVTALVTFALMIPVAATFDYPPGRRRRGMAGYTATVVAALAVGGMLLTLPSPALQPLGVAFAVAGGLGLALSGLAGNLLAR